MSTVHHRALHLTSQRSCLELGVCQGREPAGTGCQHNDTAKALASSAQASRDTGCCVVFGDHDLDEFKETLTPFERIAYWGAVGFAVGLSVFATFGAAGYLSVKAFGL